MAGGVYHHIEIAKLAYRVTDRAMHFALVRHIGRNCQRFAACRSYRGLDIYQRRSIATNSHYASLSLGEFQCNGPANTRSRSRHQNYFALEAGFHGSFPATLSLHRERLCRIKSGVVSFSSESQRHILTYATES